MSSPGETEKTQNAVFSSRIISETAISPAYLEAEVIYNLDKLEIMRIFPIGDEPSGKSWTGFQSVQDGRGYFIIFKEANDSSKYEMKTWLSAGRIVKCTPIVGNGKSFSCKIGKNGAVTFELIKENSYTLYKYSIE